MEEQDIYERSEALQRELEAVQRAIRELDTSPEWVDRHDPRHPGELRGTVEEVGFSSQLGSAMLLIDGDWLEVGHKRLREAVYALRPQVGDEIVVECLGKRGTTYDYALSVNGRSWP